MKFGFFQLLIMILSISSITAKKTKAQLSLNQQVYVSANNDPLIDILEDLETKFDVEFTYSIQKVDVSQTIKTEIEGRNLNVIMDVLLEPLGIKYHVFNNHNVVLSRDVRESAYKGISLTGQVQNSYGEPIQFVNTILTSPEHSEIIQGMVTDEFGRFAFENLEEGSYRLGLSFIGYESYDTLININTSMNISKIVLGENANVLDELNIVSRRKLVKQQLDRLIVDVEHSMLANRGNALDVLRSTPGVNVNNDRINMMGKSAVRIMINEKIIDIPYEDLADFLRSISSENISEVEVISIPPSKYDAEGNSGLINFVMKKAELESWNSSVKVGYQQRYKATSNIGANFNYNKKKFSLASSLYYVDGYYYQEQDDYAHFDDGLWYTTSPLLNDYKRFNGRIDMTYQLTDRWSIGGQYIYNQNRMHVTDAPYTPVYDYETNEIIKYLKSTESVMDWKPKFNAINLNNTFNIDTLGKKMIVNIDYFAYKNSDVREYKGEYVITESDQKLHYEGINSNDQKIKNISSGIDFEWPTAWANFEFGGKMSISLSNNDISLFNSGLVDKIAPNLPRISNDFEYSENLQAVYLSGSKKITDQLQLKLGLRFEALQSNSKSKSFGLDDNDKQQKLFPTFYLQYKPSEKSSYVLAYNKRVSRPYFIQLNPNLYYVNPFQTISGNAFLKPSYTDNIELSALHGSLSSKLYFSNQNGIFNQVPLPNPKDNTISFTNLNYMDSKRFGISESYTFDELDWWTSSNTVDVNYIISQINLENTPQKLNGLNSSISTYNDFTIKSIKGLSWSLGYSYVFAGYNDVFRLLPSSNLSTSVQYFLLDKKLKISLSANDMLKGQAERTEAYVNGVYQTARYYYDSRSVALNIVYNFGNKKISANKLKTSNQEERSRTGN